MSIFRVLIGVLPLCVKNIDILFCINGAPCNSYTHWPINETFIPKLKSFLIKTYIYRRTLTSSSFSVHVGPIKKGLPDSFSICPLPKRGLNDRTSTTRMNKLNMISVKYKKDLAIRFSCLVVDFLALEFQAFMYFV